MRNISGFEVNPVLFPVAVETEPEIPELTHQTDLQSLIFTIINSLITYDKYGGSTTLVPHQLIFISL